MPSREFAEAAGEIIGKRLLVAWRRALRRLLAHQDLVVPRQELVSRGEAFGFGHGEQLRLVGFPLDVADHGQRHAVLPHPADRHEAQETHEKIAHAAFRAADIGHLGEHDAELIHLLPDPIDVD